MVNGMVLFEGCLCDRSGQLTPYSKRLTASVQLFTSFTFVLHREAHNITFKFSTLEPTSPTTLTTNPWILRFIAGGTILISHFSTLNQVKDVVSTKQKKEK